MCRFGNVLAAGIIALILLGAGAFASAPLAAASMSDAEKTALKQATDACKAQVKEQAQFHEMSWWARHKAVKNCVKETLAHH
jgi:hypothetical protein